MRVTVDVHLQLHSDEEDTALGLPLLMTTKHKQEAKPVAPCVNPLGCVTGVTLKGSLLSFSSSLLVEIIRELATQILVCANNIITDAVRSLISYLTPLKAR